MKKGLKRKNLKNPQNLESFLDKKVLVNLWTGPKRFGLELPSINVKFEGKLMFDPDENTYFVRSVNTDFESSKITFSDLDVKSIRFLDFGNIPIISLAP